MIFNTYEEEIDYILEYYGPSALILSEEESWILSQDEDILLLLEERDYFLLLEEPKINWLKEGF
jgi:hypothetical protein